MSKQLWKLSKILVYQDLANWASKPSQDMYINIAGGGKIV